MTDLSQQIEHPPEPDESSTTIWDDIKAFAADVLQDLVEILQDFFFWCLEQLFGLFLAVLDLLPLPDIPAFDWSGLEPILYFADRLQVDVALGIYGAGLIFRLTRKFLTLGQW